MTLSMILFLLFLEKYIIFSIFCIEKKKIKRITYTTHNNEFFDKYFYYISLSNKNWIKN